MRDWTLTAEPDQDETETQIEFDQITGDWDHEDDTITNTDHVTNLNEALEHHLGGAYTELDTEYREKLVENFITIVNESTWVHISPISHEIHITHGDEEENIALSEAAFEIISPETGHENAQMALHKLNGGFLPAPM